MSQPASPTGLFDATGAPLPRMPDRVGPATNGIVFNERGEVLMQRRADNGFWGLPGGGVDPGESVEQGAIREVFEETGLTVAVKRLVGIYSDPRTYCIMSYPNGPIVHYVTVLFECEYVSGELRVSEESTDIGYFDPQALPEKTLLSHRIRIRDALAQSATPFVK